MKWALGLRLGPHQIGHLVDFQGIQDRLLQYDPEKDFEKNAELVLGQLAKLGMADNEIEVLSFRKMSNHSRLDE